MLVFSFSFSVNSPAPTIAAFCDGDDAPEHVGSHQAPWPRRHRENARRRGEWGDEPVIMIGSSLRDNTQSMPIGAPILGGASIGTRSEVGNITPKPTHRLGQ